MGKGMQLVQPIRDRKQIENMKRFLKDHNIRDWLLFIIGINSGLRISDLLKLQVENVAAKDNVEIVEKKTSKRKRFRLGDKTKKAISEYLKVTGLKDGPLFPSNKTGKAISSVQAWRIINSAAKAVGIADRIGCHSMRKSFGYHAWKSGIDIYVIMQALNHSHPSQTKRYVGLTQDELDQVYTNLDL